MSESLVGRNVAATRQNAGSTRAVSVSAAPGGVNGPASIAWARVMVTLESASADSAWHEPAACSLESGASATTNNALALAVRNLMTLPRGLYALMRT